MEGSLEPERPHRWGAQEAAERLMGVMTTALCYHRRFAASGTRLVCSHRNGVEKEGS